jgi:hypothetical protein
MDANRVLLTMLLRDADLRIGADGAARLCTSMGRMGMALTQRGRDGTEPPALRHEKSPAAWIALVRAIADIAEA